MEKSRFRIHCLVICLLLALGLILSGCSGSNETVENVITTENIEMVSVELFDKSSKDLNAEQIKKMVTFINEAELTKEESVQDIPSKSPLGRISINDGEEVLYYYQNGDVFYIEKPYEGIFKDSEDVDRFLAEL